MKSALCVDRLNDVLVSVSTDAVTERTDLLAAATDVTSVADEFSHNCSVEVQRNIKKVLSDVEKARTDIKAPVLELGRKIDALAKDFCAPLVAEAARLNQIDTAYVVEQRKKADEAERTRRAELAKIEAEKVRLAAEEARRKEAARLAELKAKEAVEAEQVAFDKQERDAANDAKAKAELDRITQENAATEAKRKLAELEAQRISTANATVKRPVKTDGQNVKEVWKFEVTDLKKLALDNWDLVRVEPNTAAINRNLAQGMRACPGLRIYSEIETNVRA
jgi:hypothetical protein